MGRLTTLTLTSHLGRAYPVEIFSPDTEFEDTGAVYLLLRMPEGRSLQAQVLYVSESDALRRALAHDRRPGGPWERASALGFDTVAALPLARAADRARIAEEFVQSWHPCCNAASAGRARLLGLDAPAGFRMRRAMAAR